jgi:hypothetical protein
MAKPFVPNDSAKLQSPNPAWNLSHDFFRSLWQRLAMA